MILAAEAADWLAAIGLVLDVFGVVILGVGVAMQSRTEIEKHSGTFYWGRGPSPSGVRRGLLSRFDTWWGVGYLVVGFLLQGAAAVGVRMTSAIGALVVVAVAFAGFCLWFVMRRR